MSFWWNITSSIDRATVEVMNFYWHIFYITAALLWSRRSSFWVWASRGLLLHEHDEHDEVEKNGELWMIGLRSEHARVDWTNISCRWLVLSCSNAINPGCQLLVTCLGQGSTAVDIFGITQLLLTDEATTACIPSSSSSNLIILIMDP